MHRKFEINEHELTIAGLSETFDLKQSLSDLYIRNSHLEDQLLEQQESAQKELKQFIVNILEVDDAMDRIIARQVPVGTDVRLIKSVEATRRLLGQKLARLGVRRMELVGSVMDPNLGDIEETEARPELEAETVLEEIVIGYWWNEKILRRAKVIVAA